MNEAAVQSRVRLAMAEAGGTPMRNNVGACEDKTGRIIRYGLMNSSAQENRQFKSSDIVGPVPIVIQPHHVGRVLGIFANFECKHSDWLFSPSDERAAAQLRYIEVMRKAGCIAGFVRSGEDVGAYIGAFR